VSLRSRIALILAAVVVSYALIDQLLQHTFVLPRFRELETKSAQSEIERVRNALLDEVERVDDHARRLASWDELYAYVQADPEHDDAELERFERANFGLGSFRSSGLNLIYVVDREGEVHFGALYDLTSGERLRWRDVEMQRFSPNNHPLLVKERTSAAGEPLTPLNVRGLVLTDAGPMAMSSRPILDSNGGGEWLGTLVIGRLFSEEVVERIAQQTRTHIEIWPLDGAPIPPDDQAHVDSVTSTSKPVIVERDADWLAAYTSIDDARNIPALLVRADVSRHISRSGGEAARYAFISTATSGCLLLLVLLYVLRSSVIDPIAKLTRHAVEIGASDDYSRRLDVKRTDELGALAREFDNMLGKLERSHEAMVRTARDAGMSEIATGILHNIGNVLNSVNVSANMLSTRLRESKVGKLEKLRDLVESKGEALGEFIAGDPKGKHVAPFLGEVTRSLRSEHDEQAREIASLAEGIEHMRALVAAQQELAGSSEVREPVDVRAQIELAREIAARAAGPSDAPSFELAVEDFGRPRLDRHKLVQILVNLIKNASESIAERGGAGRIRVGAALDGHSLRIEVSDDGVGIAPENLTRIFHHGFTTKRGGHGFGLHSSANAAVEMGGKLGARSEGPGRGATFVLELPLEKRAAAA
jgi:two-component system NtrC family sensor kinase